MLATLAGSLCMSCGEMFYGRRRVCPRCGGRNLASQSFSGKGDIYSYTVVHESPVALVGQAPYALALVHLAEGPYVTAQLVEIDPPGLFIGLPVEVASDNGFCTFRPRRSLVE